MQRQATSNPMNIWVLLSWNSWTGNIYWYKELSVKSNSGVFLSVPKRHISIYVQTSPVVSDRYICLMKALPCNMTTCSASVLVEVVRAIAEPGALLQVNSIRLRATQSGTMTYDMSCVDTLSFLSEWKKKTEWHKRCNSISFSAWWQAHEKVITCQE